MDSMSEFSSEGTKAMFDFIAATMPVHADSDADLLRVSHTRSSDGDVPAPLGDLWDAAPDAGMLSLDIRAMLKAPPADK